MKVLILAGGSGTRLWPMSREFFPKQFLKFNELNDKSLFQMTFERALKITDIKEVLIITNENLKFLVMGQIEELGLLCIEENIIVEPEGKDTLNAIALGLEKIEGNGLFMPSDHYVKNDSEFISKLEIAEELAQKSLVTFGIKPRSPKTEYGYIKYQENTVLKFIEKPDLETAKKYIKEGYLWNSGIFLFNKEVFLTELNKVNTELAELVKSGKILESFSELEKNSIDFGLLEKSENISIVPLDLEWSDLGSFDAISEEFTISDDENEEDKESFGNYLSSGDFVFENSNNNFVKTFDDKIVALCDVDDLLVVDSDDALMICKKNSSQKVKNVLNKLKKRDDERLKFHTTVYRPWGSFTILEDAPSHKVKRLTVYPGKILSLQSHNHRSEHWTVVKGTAFVVNGENEMFLESNESTYIPCGNKHRLGNKSDKNLEIIEVQTGDYFGEDDIIRYDDEYGRK